MDVLDTVVVLVVVLGNVKRTEQRCHIELHNVGQVCSKHKSGRLILLGFHAKAWHS